MPATTTTGTEQPLRPLLEVERLSVRFGAQQVLRDISLSVPTGQTLVVLGESGCGKTVLLKTLIGLVKPTGPGHPAHPLWICVSGSGPV